MFGANLSKICRFVFASFSASLDLDHSLTVPRSSKPFLSLCLSLLTYSSFSPKMAELTRLSVSSTLCSFQYLSKLEVYVDVKPYFFSGPLKSEHESMRTNLHYTEHEGIPVRDVRGSEDELNIDMHGFCSVRRESSIDLSEPDDTATVAYIRETCETIRELFNAEHVVCYDYRVSEPPMHPSPTQNNMIL